MDDNEILYPSPEDLDSAIAVYEKQFDEKVERPDKKIYLRSLGIGDVSLTAKPDGLIGEETVLDIIFTDFRDKLHATYFAKFQLWMWVTGRTKCIAYRTRTYQREEVLYDEKMAEDLLNQIREQLNSDKKELVSTSDMLRLLGYYF